MQSSSPSYISLDGAVSEACIYRRNGGCAVLVDAKLYVWGGEGAEQRVFPTAADEDEEDDSDSDDEVEVVDVWTVTSLPPPRLKLTGAPFDVFDMNTCSWSRQKTAGDIPLLGLGSSINYHPQTRTMYLFGGWNEGHFDGNVYRVQVDDWHWEKAEIKNGNMKPSGRYLTGVLIHESRMCVLGGVGPDIVKTSSGEAQDAGASYAVAYTQGEGFGWNNEYYEFDMEFDEWSAPLGKDAVRPDPLGGHCFTKFDSHRALLFGGRYESGRKNDTWIFDLEKRKFTERLKIADPLPTGRSFATLTPLINPQIVGQKLGGSGPVLQQRMLLLWGKHVNDVILPEAWVLLMLPNNHFAWRQVTINLYPRSWHTATPLYHCTSTECRLAIFGGNVHTEGFTGKRRNTADMRILTFGVVSLARQCANVIAREGRGFLSTNKLPPYSQAYILLDRAIQTLTNFKPIVMEHFF